MSLVKLKYTGTDINLNDGILAPNFPNRSGLALHSYVSNKPTLTTTSRMYGTTDMNWTSSGMKKTNRDSLYSFWNTQLSQGYNTFTIVDNKSRLLFETSWNDWDEVFRKDRGGIYDVNYNFKSPFSWTPSLFGCYPIVLAGSSLYSHTLQPYSDIPLISGTKSNDGNVLRENGYALKLTGTGGIDVGAYSDTVNFERHKDNNSMAFFCQVRCPSISTGGLYLMRLFNSTLEMSLWVSSGGNTIVGDIYYSGGYDEVENNGTTTLPADTWYDLCFTIDAVNNNMYLYTWPSGDSSFTHFLSGESTITDHLVSNLSPSNMIDALKFTECYLFQEGGSGALSGSAYMQNVFFIDDYITTMEYNFLRRLCYFWNKKTGDYPK